MFISKNSLIILIIFSFILSGCSRGFQWDNKIFYQGNSIDSCIVNIPRKLIRTVSVYDQFETLGIFNAILITPEVIKAYVDLHTYKYNLSTSEAKCLFEREYRNKVEKYLSFFVLAFEPLRFESPLFIPSLYENSPWVVALEVNGKIHRPYFIEMVELETEYKLFFGKCFSTFKKSYLLQFLHKDNLGKCLINYGDIELVFSYLTNKVCLKWKKKQE